MSAAGDHIPPVVRTLLEERADSVSSTDAERVFRRLAPELKRQAQWSMSHWSYPDGGRSATTLPAGFIVTASGALNPLSHRGICADAECRTRAALHFARTIGLYADIVTLPDALTAEFFFAKRWTRAAKTAFVNDVAVLRVLEPLITAGVIRFRTAAPAYCAEHYKRFEERVTAAVHELLPFLLPEIAFEQVGDYIFVKTGKLYEQSSVVLVPLRAADRRYLAGGGSLDEIGTREFAQSLEYAVRGALIDMNSSARLHSSLFSASRLDLLAMHSLETKMPALRDIEVWEQARSVDLPWVRQLSVGDIVALRQCAATALPRFRETMLTVLAKPNVSASDVFEHIAALRSDAAEVEAELKALNPGRGVTFRNVAGTLATTISVYGFAAELASAAVALGSLMSVLGLLHVSARKDEQDTAKLIARPGYVLLKARELAHRHSGGG